jgi:hypothetical protein
VGQGDQHESQTLLLYACRNLAGCFACIWTRDATDFKAESRSRCNIAVHRFWQVVSHKMGTIFGGNAGPATPAGIRMHGIFADASTGFSLQFFPESVILGCGPISARAYPYTVSATAGGGLIKIDAADHPLSVTIRADGSLDPGSGPYQVHGRMINGPTVSDNYTFLPVEKSCNLGPLAVARNIPSTDGTTPHP